MFRIVKTHELLCRIMLVTVASEQRSFESSLTPRSSSKQTGALHQIRRKNYCGYAGRSRRPKGFPSKRRECLQTVMPHGFSRRLRCRAEKTFNIHYVALQYTAYLFVSRNACLSNPPNPYSTLDVTDESNLNRKRRLY